jgi:hypothetical protein
MAQHPGFRSHLRLVRSYLCANPPGEHWSHLNERESSKVHPKKALRVRAMAEIQATGCVSSVTNAYGVGRSEGVVRGNYKYEVTKTSVVDGVNTAKICRVTVDCDTKRSLFCGWLMEMLKEGMANVPAVIGGVPVRFIKTPDPMVLGEMYTSHYHDSGVAIHSDDGIYHLHCIDGVLTAEVDIESCDSSNSIHTARLMREVAPEEYRELIDALISHGQQEIQIGYGKKKIRAVPKEFFEYSGALFTTAINTLAMLMCAFHILSGYSRSMTMEQVKQLFRERVATAPYSLSVSFPKSFWGGMFLKTYPCRTHSGDIVAILAQGVILRASGRTNGDFPGTGELQPRVDKYMREWVMGLKHAGNSSLLRAYQTKFPPRRGDQALKETGAISRFQLGTNSLEELDESCIAQCYDMTPQEWEELVSLLTTCAFGQSIACTASAKILKKDYNLQVPGF